MLDDAHDFSKDKAAARRYTDEEIAALGRFEIPRERSGDRLKRFLERQKLRRATNKLFAEEKAVATLSASPTPWGLMRVGNGGSPDPDENPGPPALVVAAESYDRLLRLLEGDKPVEVEVNVQAAFHADDLNAYNTVAEIPGTDKRGELVMLGAHLDSWHTGTGATDNAAGCAVAMEAVRILKALGLRPRRTIRIALWSGEEEGLLGSAAYAAQHFGSRPEPTDPEQKKLPAMLRKSTGPLALKPEQARISAYFNLDNGSGKVRGLYSQENAAVVPIFEAWLRPLRDLGADTITERPTGGTDHLSFDEVGVPGFQFIQDELDYMNLTHHTDMDVYDHLERDDLMQASVVMAAVVYDAAMRPEKLPRKPLPKE